MRALRIGSGHFAHTKSSTCSYLVSSVEMHCEQRYPEYPWSQDTGNSEVALYPPKHASSFGHSIIVVEFVVLLQYPWDTSSTSPPGQLARGMQVSHVVEFHCKEYVPGEQVLQLFPAVIYSPGLQNLKLTTTDCCEKLLP